MPSPSKWANDELMERFKSHITNWTHVAFVEGCLVGVRAEKTNTTASLARETALREALERVMIGGNHVALLIGTDHPPAGTSHDEALQHYGAGDRYEAWCCWNTIMEARATLAAAPPAGAGEREKPKSKGIDLNKEGTSCQ